LHLCKYYPDYYFFEIYYRLRTINLDEFGNGKRNEVIVLATISAAKTASA
jgi:hypothetical protein